MLDNVDSLLKKYLPKPDTRVIAGVSGGPDSLVMLDMLHKFGLNLVVAHLHHGIRQSADRDLHFVELEANKRHLPFFTKKINIPRVAEQTGHSIEEAGRVARYQFLFELAGDQEASAVAVGHTADDQVETILMHMLRGSGLEGLRGMQFFWLPNPWSTEIPLLRPLLGLWRKEIMAYCAENALDPIEDESNQDAAYFRNRLRNELIPYLSTYNPKIKQTIWKLGSVATEDYNLLRSIYDQGWSDIVLQTGPHFVKLDRDSFKTMPIGIQRMILRDTARYLDQDIRDIGFDLLEKALQFSCSSRSTGKIELAQGLELELLEHVLWIRSSEFSINEADWPYMGMGQVIKLKIPGETLISPDWEIKAKWLNVSQLDLDTLIRNSDLYQAFLQPEEAVDSIVIRTRLAGDRLHPLGMGGKTQKLSDYMVNAKIPRIARRTWPVVCIRDEVVWLPGYSIHHNFRVQNNSARILQLVLTQTSLGETGSIE